MGTCPNEALGMINDCDIGLLYENKVSKYTMGGTMTRT